MNKRVKKPDSWFVQKLIEMEACDDAVEYAQTKRTFLEAWNACDNPSWLRWLVQRLGLAPNHFGSAGNCSGCAWEVRHRTLSAVRRPFPADRVAKALRAHK